MSERLAAWVCALIGHRPRHDYYPRRDPRHEVLVDRESCGRCGALLSTTDRVVLERLDDF